MQATKEPISLTGRCNRKQCCQQKHPSSHPVRKQAQKHHPMKFGRISQGGTKIAGSDFEFLDCNRCSADHALNPWFLYWLVSILSLRLHCFKESCETQKCGLLPSHRRCQKKTQVQDRKSSYLWNTWMIIHRSMPFNCSGETWLCIPYQHWHWHGDLILWNGVILHLLCALNCVFF